MPVVDTTEYSHLFEATIRACGKCRPRGRQQHITAFWPIAGASYRAGRSLMVVGRAVNGWLKQPLSLAGEPSQESIQELRQAAQVPAFADQPLGWLGRRPEADSSDYNPRRSQFWGVARRLVGEEKPDAWWSRLAWSNLYKIAPHDGGNPGVVLRRAQRPYIARLLEHEVELLKPRALVLLTGWKGWASEALGGSVKTREADDLTFVEARGRWHGIPVAVAPHPQTRPVGRVVEDLRQCLGMD